MATTYNYTKTPVAVDRLTQEIRDSAIIIVLDHITVFGNSLDITFKAELSSEDHNILDTIVANHSGEPLPSDGLPVIVSEPAEVIPTTVKNEHCMQPWGAIKGYFETKGDSEIGTDLVCDITLSNKSIDGLTFTYNSDIAIVPTIGNYVFQRECTKKSWATAVDTINHSITFEKPYLNEGIGIYSKGYWLDCTVPDWKPTMFLWGMTINSFEYNASGMIDEDPCTDFIELSVVDESDIFKTDEVCMALFGVPASGAAPYIIAMGWEDNGEFGHWTKYYDESWLVNCKGVYIPAPDGSPGELLPYLVLRLSFFSTDNDLHKYHVFLDYYPTSK